MNEICNGGRRLIFMVRRFILCNRDGGVTFGVFSRSFSLSVFLLAIVFFIFLFVFEEMMNCRYGGW